LLSLSWVVQNRWEEFSKLIKRTVVRMNIFGAKNNVHWNEFFKTGKINDCWDKFFCPIKIFVAYTNILDVQKSKAIWVLLVCKNNGLWDEFFKTSKINSRWKIKSQKETWRLVSPPSVKIFGEIMSLRQVFSNLVSPPLTKIFSGKYRRWAEFSWRKKKLSLKRVLIGI